MLRFFRNLLTGHARRHRLEAVLCVLGVALGVAVVVGIDAAVAACVRSFGGAVQSLAERSTHSVFAAEGAIADEQYIRNIVDILFRTRLVEVKPAPRELAAAESQS